MNPVRFRSRRAGMVLPLVAGAATAVLLIGGPGGPPAGAADDRFQAGERATTRTPVAAGEEAQVQARGLAQARTLGVPTGMRVETTRVADRFAGTVSDEVATFDERGQRLGLVRMDLNGRLAAAVRFGWPDASARKVSGPAAIVRATALAGGVGLAIAGTPEVATDVDGGWRVTWPRFVGGVAVPGDGVAVTLFADGTFHAAARQERALAPAPLVTISRGTAERLAGDRLAALLGPTDSGSSRIVKARLAWIAPNDTFDGRGPDAPDTVLRLAWIVEARTSGPLAERLRALELYLDASDGSLLGGDLLR